MERGQLGRLAVFDRVYGGSLGLIAGFCSAFSHGSVFKWITCAAAMAVVLVSAIYAAGFIFGRTAGVPLSDSMYFDSMYFGGFHAPILLLYAMAILTCLIEALLYLPGHKRAGGTLNIG